MKATVVLAAERLAARATAVGLSGTVVAVAEFDVLEANLGLQLPVWFRQLFTAVPLCGLPLEWQQRPPTDDCDGLVFVEWATARDIRSESLACYPGLAIRRHGYVNVAGNDGSGDPLFVCVHDGDDPPLYRVYHDVSTLGEVIVAKGRSMVAPALSAFFEMAIVRPE